jgi:hypothetical protein
MRWFGKRDSDTERIQRQTLDVGKKNLRWQRYAVVIAVLAAVALIYVALKSSGPGEQPPKIVNAVAVSSGGSSRVEITVANRSANPLSVNSISVTSTPIIQTTCTLPTPIIPAIYQIRAALVGGSKSDGRHVYRLTATEAEGSLEGYPLPITGTLDTPARCTNLYRSASLQFSLPLEVILAPRNTGTLSLQFFAPPVVDPSTWFYWPIPGNGDYRMTVDLVASSGAHLKGTIEPSGVLSGANSQ